MEPIQTFKLRNDLPKELYELDILDGSPPCSTFSMAGKREEGWGKDKQFREGQSKQVLSDLFFDFIDLTEKLKPKIVISENVKGMLAGNAKGYIKEIIKRFDAIGYNSQIFLLNAASMGVPQKRERIFIISRRKDLNLPELKLQFNDKPIYFKEISDESNKDKDLTPLFEKYWDISKEGQSVGKFKALKKLKYSDVSPTIVAGTRHFHSSYKRPLNDNEIIKISTFPQDYNFLKSDVCYVCGMSVPPIMMAKVIEQIKLQLFKYDNK